MIDRSTRRPIDAVSRIARASARTARRFKEDLRGNIAMISGMLVVPLIGATGGAVDYMHFMTIRSEIQGALDTGVLAAASLSNSKPAQLVIADYLAANLDPGIVDPDNVTISVTSERSLNTATVIVTANYSFEPVFLDIFGVKSLPISVSVGGTQSVQEVEISMVLDISSSMNGSKFVALKDAAEEFIDAVLAEEVVDVTSVNLVPFGGTVRLPSQFDGFVEPTSPIDYEGCLEFDHFNPATFSFSGDDYHYLYEDGDDDEDEDRTNNEKSDGKHSNSYHQPVPHAYKWTKTNPWCPRESTEAVFLSNDADELKDRIDAMEMSDGTGMDIGAMVGLIGLDPRWRGKIGGTFADRPTDYNSETLKVLLIMTDGEITAQFRPKILKPRSWEDDMTKINQREDELDNDRNERQRISVGEARSMFYDICEHARDQNILVFTIGFQIDTNNWSHKALGDCPQSKSQYYFVEDLNIKTAFNSIAASINNLRLTK